jgi:uncharacterized membrane protein YeaQ/YmgE (transglycosylase-associated protein family)
MLLGGQERSAYDPASWVLSLVLGLAGALVGYVIFTLGLGIGDTDIFDWGGLLRAIIGTLIVLGLAGYFLRRRQPGPPPRRDGRRARAAAPSGDPAPAGAATSPLCGPYR